MKTDISRLDPPCAMRFAKFGLSNVRGRLRRFIYIAFMMEKFFNIESKKMKEIECER
jgi:hypothetical protein